MNVNPISQTIQNNYSVKKSPNFKGFISPEGFKTLECHCPAEEIPKVFNFVRNASDDVWLGSGFFDFPALLVPFPRGKQEGFNIVMVDKTRSAIKERIAEYIANDAKSGEIDDAYINHLMALFPKDEELCEFIKQKIEEFSAINETMAKEKKYYAEKLAKKEEALKAERARVEKEKETAFKTAYPILSALGLYGIFKNGKLPQKALQKAAKMVK